MASAGTTAPTAVLEVDNDGDSSAYLPGATCITGIPNDCSLRQAILTANGNAGLDIIRFDVSLYPGGMTIAPNSQLPEITRPVEIDGVSGTGGSCPTTNGPAELPITLDGRNLSNGERGLTLGFYVDNSDPFNNTNSNGSTVRGLNIINFPGSGILIDGTDDHAIVCNHIGLRDGSATAGNLIGVNVSTSFADDNTIGGGNVTDRNVISGNSADGIRITGNATLVEGNYIGLDRTGTLNRGNGGNGIIVTSVASNAVIENNTVSANEGDGIYADINGVTITGNLLGADAAGTLARGNEGTGITVLADSATILDNVIADNNYGIILVGDNHVIQGNHIGTAADGNSALGNTGYGIFVRGGGVTIGGDDPNTERNIIAANQSAGIWLWTDDTTGAVVQGNHIGVGADGSTPLGNGGNGIQISDGASDNRVGQAGAENIIAHNGSNGVRVIDSSSMGNDLRDNIFENNGALAIDLVGSGEDVGEVTPNDVNDADTGPNGLQNHMTLTVAEPDGRVQGVLQGPDGDYMLHIYQLDTCDGSGFGEGGDNLVYFSPNTTVSGGVFNFDEVLSPAPPPGSYLVTLIRDEDGNTSEFGNCRQVAEAGFVVDSTADFSDNNPGDGDCEAVGTNVCTLRAAIEEANALGGGPYTISFNLGPITQVRTIGPDSALPPITTPVIIDASTMTNASCPVGTSAAYHRLVLDGTNAPGDGLQLAASAGGSAIRGLEIRNFSDDAIQVDGDANVIACNTLDNNFRGLNVNGDDNQIGGAAFSERNVISNNSNSGMRLGDSATLNKVQGNFIGVAGDGVTAAGNGGSGVFLSGGGSNRIGGSVGFAANVIAANGNHGISLDPGSGGNQIWGNIIGLDVSGSALGNSGSGVYVDGAGSNEIGGDSDGKRNVIAANGVHGVFVNSDGNVIRRNYIGTDLDGLAALGNGRVGIRLIDGDNNVIGGDNAVDGNVIAGNGGSGVYASGSAVGALIRHNAIGVNAGGSPLGNVGNGVGLAEQVEQAEVRDNTIAHNGEAGIVATETVILSNFAGNAIHNNGELGIDLNDDGVANLNDSGDGDGGGNGLMNFPVILGADAGSNIVTIYLNSLASRDYRIHVYRNQSCDSSGYGEGQQYLGSFDVQTIAGNPNVQESAVMPRNFNAGDKITATATPLTNPGSDGASEFSECFTATGAPAQQLTWGDQNVGFVVNATAGMQPVIDRVEAAWAQNAWANCPTCTPDTLHLAPFRDTAVHLGSTTNPEQFGAWLGALEAAGGDACADATFDALRTFGLNLGDGSAPVSDALVFSDSAPAGNRRAFGYVLDQLIARGIQVHNVGPTLCSDGNLPDFAMDYLSLLTGGAFHRPESLDEYPADAQMAMNLALAPDMLGAFRGTLDNATAVFPIAVDSSITSIGLDYTIRCLTCTDPPPEDLANIVMTSQNITVELLNPEGNVVDDTVPGYQQWRTSTRAMQMLFGSVGAANAGTWQLRVSGTGDYAVNVFGDSNVHMTVLGQHAARANNPFPVSALLKAETGANCSGGCQPITATLTLVGLDNMETFPVTLDGDGATGPIYSGAATVTTPGLYRLMATGELENGDAFMRVDPTPIRVRAHGMSGSENATAVPDSTRAISFELSNDGTGGSTGPTTFALELFSELGWTETGSIPDSVTLAAGESAVFTVDAVIPANADIGLVEESVLVAIPEDDLSASVSVSVQTTVIEQLSIFLPVIGR